MLLKTKDEYTAILDFNSDNNLLASDIEQLKKTAARYSSKASELSNSLKAFLDFSPTFKLLIFIMFLAWSGSAYLDGSLSFPLWADATNSEAGGAVVAMLRILLAILASSMIAEPIFKSFAHGRFEKYKGSAIMRLSQKRSKTNWLTPLFGISLSAVLIALMYGATESRLTLELDARIFGSFSMVQKFLPPAAVIIEIICGVVMLEFSVLFWRGLRKLGVSFRSSIVISRLHRKQKILSANWEAMQIDLNSLRHMDKAMPKLYLSKPLFRQLRAIDDGFNNKLNYFDTLGGTLFDSIEEESREPIY